MNPKSQSSSRYIKSLEIQKKFEELVPGGSHTYSKGADQHPYLSPKFVVEAKGAKCTDIDGNEYIDWMMGNRTFILGHCNEIVDAAVIEQLQLGVNFSRPGILEYELAEYLIDLWPSAEMVKFGKNGSDVTHAAVKLARAYTGRKYIAKCSEHPFFGTQDWFMSDTPCNGGILENGHYVVNFEYNDIESVTKIFDKHENEIACLILEPVKNDAPVNNFLVELRELCSQKGVVLIFDEMISGIRFDLRGAHHLWGVYPDLVTFGKCISNGYSFSALAGNRDIMQLGGLKHDNKRTFLLSQTHSSETLGLVAARATLEECQKINVTDHIWNLGRDLKQRFNQLTSDSEIAEFISMVGFDCNPALSFRSSENYSSNEIMSYFHQEALQKGLLCSWFSITSAHTKLHVDQTLELLSDVLAKVKGSLENDTLRSDLVGEPAKPVMRSFNKCLKRKCGKLYSTEKLMSCCLE